MMHPFAHPFMLRHRPAPRSVLRRLLACIGAVLLAGALAACSTPGTAPEATALPAIDPVSQDWSGDMAAFAALDTAQPPPADPVVFTGSSSVRMWTTLARDFPGIAVLNRGFGGSQVRDAVWHADEVAIRYRPRQVVFYAGDNDIDAGRSPQQIVDDLQAFVTRLRRDLPHVRISYLAIKPSPLRIGQLGRQQEANARVRAWLATQGNTDFIDVSTPMLDAKGQPRADLFIGDRLHMSPAGYVLWRQVVAPYLER